MFFGSDTTAPAHPSVLKAMARGYTVDRYRRIIERIRQRMPDASISADVIVAFPGETDADFEATFPFIAYARDKAIYRWGVRHASRKILKPEH